MTTDDPADSPEPSGHQIDVGSFLRDVVHLMCCIDTGPSLRHIWRRERPDRDNDEQLLKFTSIAYAHLRSEVPRLLIAAAATLRAKADDGSWAIKNENVGWLSPGEQLDSERGEAINVREACNKIIHAKAVKPRPVTERDGTETIGALIILRGDRNAKPWTAEINLREFCIAVANTNFSPHGTGGCQHLGYRASAISNSHGRGALQPETWRRSKISTTPFRIFSGYSRIDRVSTDLVDDLAGACPDDSTTRTAL